MLKFYWQLLPEVVHVFRGTVQTWTFWVGTVALGVILALNPEWVRWLRLQKFPRWSGVALFALALLFAFLRANHRRFQTKEGEISVLQARLEAVASAAPTLVVDYNLVPPLDAIPPGAPTRILYLRPDDPDRQLVIMGGGLAPRFTGSPDLGP